MNFNKIKVVIAREYLNRVKKKSFLFITFLGPLFFAAVCLLPTLIMLGAKEETKKIAVIDESGIVLPTLEDSKTVQWQDFDGKILDSVKTNLDAYGIDGVLYVSPIDTVSKSVTAATYSAKPLGIDLTETMSGKINDAVEDYRIQSYDIKDLDKIMEDVKSDINLATYTMDQEGKETISSSEVYMMISMLLGMIIYMFIAMFCGMVMSSVIEEKASRVVEVLVSSVKATELLFGKIIGVALVALTQFLLWIVLTVAIVGVVGGIVGFDKVSTSATQADPTTQMMSSMGVDGSQMDMATMDLSAATAGEESGLAAVMTTLKSINYAEILIAFVIYFLFGYLLYASLFAAIGSAVENEADTQQLQIPVTIPLMIGFFIAFYAFKAPDSGLVFWGSIIPFTSPIVMLARIPYGVPVWQLILSIVVLIGTFIACAWASAKIYKIGILMFGKKSTFKDLWKWLKQK